MRPTVCVGAPLVALPDTELLPNDTIAPPAACSPTLLPVITVFDSLIVAKAPEYAPTAPFSDDIESLMVMSTARETAIATNPLLVFPAAVLLWTATDEPSSARTPRPLPCMST